MVHFSASSGLQIDGFKDNLEYHLGTIKSSLIIFEKFNEKILNRPAFDDDIDNELVGHFSRNPQKKGLKFALFFNHPTKVLSV